MCSVHVCGVHVHLCADVNVCLCSVYVCVVYEYLCADVHVCVCAVCMCVVCVYTCVYLALLLLISLRSYGLSLSLRLSDTQTGLPPAPRICLSAPSHHPPIPGSAQLQE